MAPVCRTALRADVARICRARDRLSTDFRSWTGLCRIDGRLVHMTSWWDAAASALLGSACAGCERPGRPWCQDCADAVEQAVDPLLVGADPPLVACCRYEDSLPDAIVGFKDRGISSLRPLLGHVLAAGVLEAVEVLTTSQVWTLEAKPVLVPAASSTSAVRKRGFDHMWDLARIAAASTELSAVRLLRAGVRSDQASLSFAARRRNLRGSMRVKHPGSGPVIIVDDVRTSGATLAECHRALYEGGYTVVGQVVIAASITDPACADTPERVSVKLSNRGSVDRRRAS